MNKIRKTENTNIGRGKMMAYSAITAIMVLVMSTSMIFANNPINNLGEWILSGLQMLIVAFALIIGIVCIVKGQTVKGIITLAAGAILFALCASPQTFASIGSTLLGALGF